MVKVSKFLISAAAIVLTGASAECAGTRNIELTVIDKGETYSFIQAAEENRPSSFSGQVRNEGGAARTLSFDPLLDREGSGDYRLQYTVELGAAGNNGSAPVQLQGDIILPPNQKKLAAEGAGWKVYLKIRAQAVKNGNARSPADSLITANASIAGLDFPLRLLASPGTQSSYTSAMNRNGTPYSYSLSLASGRPDSAGKFTLRYLLVLRTPGREIVNAGGETELKPGARLKTAAAGKDWKLELRAVKP